MVAAAAIQPCPSCASWGTLATSRLAAVEQANARVTALAANIDQISAQNTHLTTTADQLRDEIVILRGAVRERDGVIATIRAEAVVMQQQHQQQQQQQQQQFMCANTGKASFSVLSLSVSHACKALGCRTDQHCTAEQHRAVHQKQTDV